ncbi:MAG: hypothetical protein FJ304_21640 [Planctomycetes bacterium]|nr:hypothetical protein [Planctomycetota bacterium]
MSSHPPDTNEPTDAELLANVTSDGEIPLEEIGVVGGLIYTHIRGLNCYLVHVMEDNRMAEACKSYLRRIGREFRSYQELPRPATGS